MGNGFITIIEKVDKPTITSVTNNNNKSLPSNVSGASPGAAIETTNRNTNNNSKPKKSNPAPQIPSASGGAPLPPLRTKAVVIKERIPPPVPPRGSPRSTGGSSGNISSHRHHSHSSVRSSKDSLKDAGSKTLRPGAEIFV